MHFYTHFLVVNISLFFSLEHTRAVINGGMQIKYYACKYIHDKIIA